MDHKRLQLRHALREQKSLDTACPAAGFITLNDHPCQACVAGCRFKARRHVGKKTLNHQFLLYSNHTLIGADHAHVGLGLGIR